MVVDVSQVMHGIVTIESTFTTSMMESHTQFVRPHLHIFSLLPDWGRHGPHVNVWDTVWDTIRHALDRLPAPSTIPLHLGLSMHAGQWRHADSDTQCPELLSAVQFFAANHLHLRNVTAVRLGRGLKDFSLVQGCTNTVVIAWSPQCSYFRIFEPEAR